MTTYGDMIFQLGGSPVMAGVPFSKDAKYFFVDAGNGSDGNDGRAPDRALKTILAAYNKCTSGHHDTIFLIGLGSTDAWTAGLDWAKSYTHLIGVTAPTRTAQRARITQAAGTTDVSPLLTVSGSGCIFKNFYIFQGVADAGSKINVKVTGGRNYFENVHFAGGGHATQAVDGGACLMLDAAEENTFVKCTIGVDTAAQGTGFAGVLFDSEAHRNYFEGCIFRVYAGNAGVIFAEVADATGIDRDNVFDNCLFINTAAQQLTAAFAIPAGLAAPRRLYLKSCMGHGFPKWDANDRGVLFGNMNAVTGADLSGVAVEMVT